MNYKIGDWILAISEWSTLYGSYIPISSSLSKAKLPFQIINITQEDRIIWLNYAGEPLQKDHYGNPVRQTYGFSYYADRAESFTLAKTDLPCQLCNCFCLQTCTRSQWQISK